MPISLFQLPNDAEVFEIPESHRAKIRFLLDTGKLIEIPWLPKRGGRRRRGKRKVSPIPCRQVSAELVIPVIFSFNLLSSRRGEAKYRKRKGDEGLCAPQQRQLARRGFTAGIGDGSRQIIDEYQPHVIRADNAANE